MTEATTGEHGLWPEGITPTQEFFDVEDFVRTTRHNLFITGRAGTGKSTLLRALAKSIGDEQVIAAPTGIAALSVGGETLHSLFRLPRGLLVDEPPATPKDVFEVDPLTLIIDEASMVRADAMNAIDEALREQRSNNKPFGGVRIIAFGDTHQLPPVLSRRGDREALQAAFGGHYFFFAPGARSMKVVELTQVFRQRDERFIALLNEIREGDISSASLAQLNARVGDPPRNLSGDWSWLCTTNNDAAAVNKQFLDQLKGSATVYSAELNGELQQSLRFDDDGTKLPAEATLPLKIGARVIFIRNDRFRRWVNGTKGIVTRLGDSEIDVETDTGESHTVGFEKWPKYRKTKIDKQIVTTEVGSMLQLPLRLGWAITIHKSQGMTLDKVFFNTRGRVFAPGQTYVALSRAKSFEGLRLLRPLKRSEIFVSLDALAYRRLLQPMRQTWRRALP